MQRETRLLILILMLGLSLRLFSLEARTLEYDDAFSILLAGRSPGEIITGTAADTMPPLYYFLLHAWMRLSGQVWFSRMLNVAIGLGVIGVLYLWTRTLFGHQAALWAGFCAALSPLLIFHAQGMRMYLILALSLALYAWFFTRLWLEEAGRKPWIDWTGLVISGAMAMYSHNLAVFTILSFDLFLVWQRNWRLLLRLLLSQAAVAILALPWLVLVPGQVAKVQQAFWTPRPGFLEVLQALIAFHTNLPVPDRLLPAALGASILIPALVTLSLVRGAGPMDRLKLAVILALAPPVTLFALSYLMRPVFLPRPLLLSCLAYYALIGLAIARARSRAQALIIAGLFTLSALVVLPAQYGFATFPRSPFGEAGEYLLDETLKTPGSRVVHDNKLSYFPMAVRAPAIPQTFLADPPGSHNDTLALETQRALDLYPAESLEQAVGQASRVWFVVFDRAIQEYQAGGDGRHPGLAWLEQNFTERQRRVFNDLWVYEFSR
jgi:hypothetical protein